MQLIITALAGPDPLFSIHYSLVAAASAPEENNMLYSALTFILVLTFTKEVYSRSLGAPVQACNNDLTPDHGTSQASDPPGGFFIFSELFNNNNAGAYLADTTYDGKVDFV